LKVVANFGVGFNNIDVAAATARKILVTNTSDVLTDATADLTLALMLAVARRLGEGERLVRARQWSGWQPMQMLGADVTGATLGIVGFGRIGRAVARRARAFDMRVLYWNRTRLPEAEETSAGVRFADFESLLRQADFISLHVAYTSETHHLLGEPQFALMKPTAFVINTTRGAVIDEKALARALPAGRIAGAGLDVFENEPELEAGLYPLENVVLAPHLGSATTGTRTQMGMIAVNNLLAACAGGRPPNCVNPQVLV
jgi:glyoxylate reductase